jgi:hypothetical protein
MRQIIRTAIVAASPLFLAILAMANSLQFRLLPAKGMLEP